MIIVPPANFFNEGSLVPVLFAEFLSDTWGEDWILGRDVLGHNKQKGNFNLQQFIIKGEIRPQQAMPSSVGMQDLERLNEQSLFVRLEDVLLCSCGRVEVSEEALNKKRRKKLDSLNKKGLCVRCNGELLPQKVKSLYVAYPKRGKKEGLIFPLSAKSESDSLRQNAESSQLKISKQRMTGSTFSFKGEDFQIDPDFISIMFIRHMVKNFSDVKLITGRRSIPLLSTAMFFSDNFNSLFVPYLRNFKNVYTETKRKDMSPTKLFFLVAISISWKKNSAQILRKDIEKVLSIDDLKLKKVLSDELSGGWGCLRRINRDILRYV